MTGFWHGRSLGGQPDTNFPLCRPPKPESGYPDCAGEVRGTYAFHRECSSVASQVPE
jgi:hypothetical protein